MADMESSLLESHGTTGRIRRQYSFPQGPGWLDTSRRPRCVCWTGSTRDNVWGAQWYFFPADYLGPPCLHYFLHPSRATAGLVCSREDCILVRRTNGASLIGQKHH